MNDWKPSRQPITSMFPVVVTMPKGIRYIHAPRTGRIYRAWRSYGKPLDDKRPER
jgi:hypothetical protein